MSEENQLKHANFLKEEKLRYSVLEKSVPGLFGTSVCDVLRLKIADTYKNEAVNLLTSISLHEIFFNSFCGVSCRSHGIRSHFGSESAFLYEIECDIRAHDGVGFLGIFKNKSGKITWEIIEKADGKLLMNLPLLAIDLWEHAYFEDYGFDREKYITNALGHLRLDII